MMELVVRGMSCSPCARAVTNAVHGVDADAGVRIDLETKAVSVETDADEARIVAAIEEAGYKVEPMNG